MQDPKISNKDSQSLKQRVVKPLNADENKERKKIIDHDNRTRQKAGKAL